MRVFYCLFLSCLLFSCSESDSDSDGVCTPVVIDELKYNTTANFGINLIDFSLDESCLTVTLGVSGCDDDHEIDMLSSGIRSPSTGSTLFFDFYDYNPQLCEAYFTIEKEYDLTPIEDFISKEVVVRFRNSELTFIYSS